jgi:hypothetical protein
MKSVTRPGYRQYLPAHPIRYTLTYFAEYCGVFNQDAVNCYLHGMKG